MVPIPGFVTVIRDLRGQWQVAQGVFPLTAGGRQDFREPERTIGEIFYSTQAAAEAAAEKQAGERQFIHIPYDGEVVMTIPVSVRKDPRDELYMPIVLNAEGDVALQGDKARPFGEAREMAARIAMQRKAFLVPARQHRA